MTLPVLIVEDEVKIAQILRDYCLQAGYSVEVIHDGDEAMAWLERHEARILLLDLMLPGTDGFSICQSVRRQSDLPIIMLTARVEEIDRLLGLNLGADDYICKPFSPREVIARIAAILRRVEKSETENDRVSLDEHSFRVHYQNKTIELTAVEFKLFQTLFSNRGRIYTRDQLMSTIYTDNRIVTDRTIDSHIKKIRKKLKSLALDSERLHSVYGAGYKFE
ncbi:MAG: two-component system response regulator BaeR [Gammaproteobacteria bacterium]|jgi:two-component system response regulator BaeR